MGNCVTRLGRRLGRLGWYAIFGTSVGEYTKGIALNAYKKKYRESVAYRHWLNQVGDIRISEHYAHSTLTDPFVVEHAKSQLYELITTLGDRMNRVGCGQSVLDAGASDGLFLEQLGLSQHGTGFNILRACVKKIRAEGYRACCGDLDRLPFRDKTFDTVICCQALEHLVNPIHALQELERICRDRLFLTIPWLPVTRISPQPSQHAFESHIFEFSASDFRKIISHTGFTIDYARDILVLFKIRNPFHGMVMKRYLWRSYFPKLQYYELIPSS